MSEKPILFSAPMVKAILAGTKVVTRRVVGLPHLKRSETRGYDWTWRGQAPIRSVAQQVRHPMGCWQDVRDADLVRMCPYGGAGGALWVRETWSPDHRYVYPCPSIVYRADNYVDEPIECRCSYEQRRNGQMCADCLKCAGFKWRPSIFMPRGASRITLDVVNVRVERLHDITEEDAKREGIDCLSVQTGPDVMVGRPYATEFRRLWTKINGRASWESDPFVWRVEFARR